MCQIIATLPQDIPAPKFQLFQTVITGDGESLKPETGVIVGMEYVTMFTAIANHRHTYGWKYEVDFYFGAATEELLKDLEDETTDDFWESKLQPIKGGSK